MKKKGIGVALLLMAVGFAAVSTTLYINGSTNILSNDDDFRVYYSDAIVNGTQDLSVVESEISLRFTTELSTLGETYVLDYDVTNGSKNYDAALTMNCTGGNDYLTVTNDFDTDTNLEALQTRSGKLTLELTKSYTGDDLEVTIACTLTANAVERNALGEGTAASPVENPYAIGKEITLVEGETFNIISSTDDTVTMLAAYNLGTDYKQSTTAYGVSFSNSTGWEYTPGPKEVDIQSYEGNARNYVNEYVSYLQIETGDTTITGNLITLAELKTLGCTINDDYSYSSGLTCANSSNALWLANNQYWWTRSVISETNVWVVDASGNLASWFNYSEKRGVRPVITISKDALNNL